MTRERLHRFRRAHDGLSAHEQRAYLEETVRENMGAIEDAHRQALKRITLWARVRGAILILAILGPGLITLGIVLWRGIHGNGTPAAVHGAPRHE